MSSATSEKRPTEELHQIGEVAELDAREVLRTSGSAERFARQIRSEAEGGD